MSDKENKLEKKVTREMKSWKSIPLDSINLTYNREEPISLEEAKRRFGLELDDVAERTVTIIGKDTYPGFWIIKGSVSYRDGSLVENDYQFDLLRQGRRKVIFLGAREEFQIVQIN